MEALTVVIFTSKNSILKSQQSVQDSGYIWIGKPFFLLTVGPSSHWPELYLWRQQTTKAAYCRTGKQKQVRMRRLSQVLTSKTVTWVPDPHSPCRLGGFWPQRKIPPQCEYRPAQVQWMPWTLNYVSAMPFIVLVPNPARLPSGRLFFPVPSPPIRLFPSHDPFLHSIPSSLLLPPVILSCLALYAACDCLVSHSKAV